MKSKENDGHPDSRKVSEGDPLAGTPNDGLTQQEKAVEQTTSGDVKNASAAGMGAMGRNDEKLSDPGSVPDAAA